MSAYKKLAKQTRAQKKQEDGSEEEVQKGEEDTQREEKLARMRSNYKNKQHVLILASRGITSRHRHLMNDLRELMPHAKRDVKFDAKASLYEINEIADMKNCNNCIFFEGKMKRKELYMWVAKQPNGPSVKFQVTNAHTMDELKFSGNCLKGSRPLLFFDSGFDTEPQMQLIKELFSQVFGTPFMHPKSKPFIDHMMCFYYTGGRIWFRNYQIADEYLKDRPGRNKEDQVLVEIGPRFVLNPIKILAGSFCGAPIFENPTYVAPSVIRMMEKARKARMHMERAASAQDLAERRKNNKTPLNEMDVVFGREGGVFEDEDEDPDNDGSEYRGKYTKEKQQGSQDKQGENNSIGEDNMDDGDNSSNDSHDGDDDNDNQNDDDDEEMNDNSSTL